jgi:hypothetical protein
MKPKREKFLKHNFIFYTWMSWAGHGAQVGGGEENAYRVLVGKPEEALMKT